MNAHVVNKIPHGKAYLAAFIFLGVLYITANNFWPDTWARRRNLPIFNQNLVVVTEAEDIENVTSAKQNKDHNSTARNDVQKIASAKHSILYSSTARTDTKNITSTTHNIDLTNTTDGKDNQHTHFLLNSASCRILNLDPFGKDVMHLFKPREFGRCNTKPLLTRINHLTNGSFSISIEEDAEKEYHKSKHKINCCYEVITRAAGAKADSNIIKSKCTNFVKETILDKSVEFILVSCKAKRPGLKSLKLVYHDAHSIVPIKPDVKKRIDKFRAKRTEDKVETPPSVLLFGIDSVSRLNLRRVMPHTLQHLKSTGWVELNTYNKIADNTYPNLMAIFGGYDSDTAYSICRPTILGALENCSFIWSDYHDNGYVTAYSEDTASIHTFNYLKKGFLKQPTDYYSRPYFMAMESSLTVKTRSSLKYCLGSITASERIMKYMIDFTTTFKNDPYYGIFWINSLCHNTLEMPPSMDLKIKETFTELNNRGVLNNSIIFFFSDHGLRFGSVRQLPTGVLEERLPFMHVWIPEKFRASHPDLFQNLVENSNRLISPYDIHMTLQHILSLSSNYTAQPAKGCPNCNSILKPVPYDRSCAEAGINLHWCACEMYESLSIDDVNVRAAADFIIFHINNVTLAGYKQCVTLKLKKVIFARGGKDVITSQVTNQTSSVVNYLIELETTPGGAKYESTVTGNENNEFEIQGSVSRINTISTNGKCVKNPIHQLYCYCKK